MKKHLLDVNVLIALMDPLHIHHDAAHDWFSAPSHARWASCAITQNAVVRILASPAYPSVDFRPQEAIEHLGRFIQKAGEHEFWLHDLSLCDETCFNRAHIQGHRQITDIYLAGVAQMNAGALATFDRSIPWRAVRGANVDLITVIPA